jgi:glycosyltransferase involved in cell wall biosynthesis/SAM-dependent methyltransferase
MLKRLIESAPASIPNAAVVSLTSVGVIGESLRARGARVQALGMSSVLDFPIALWRLVRFIRQHRPGIVQTWLYHADLLGGLAARLAGSCIVVWGVRSTNIPQGPLSVTFWLVRLCAICSHIVPHRIICCAQSAREAHVRLGYAANRMTVIPNGYDFSTFDGHSNSRTKVRAELGFRADEIVIGVVGRFDPLKDFRNFVAAASTLAAKRGDVKFLMVGNRIDWSNPQLAGWIGDGGAAKNFRLVGEQSDAPYFLSAMDIFCLSSVNEAFPNVVVEAMAMGLPCVVTRAGDAADILGDDNFVVPVENSQALCDAMLRMCDLDPEERRVLGERGAIRVRAKYEIKEIRQKYDEVYAEATRHLADARTNNSDNQTVEGFGYEWTRFDQTGMSNEDTRRFFESYFSIFPWEALPQAAVGFDLGCGSGRWAKVVAPRVGTLHCIDPSLAIEVARKNLSSHPNCVFHQTGVDDIPLEDHSMDFGYSLGVLHHIPDTRAALTACTAKLKPGAPFLLYLYYAFDNRPMWFRALWRMSDWMRKAVSRMPRAFRYAVSQIIAGLVYWPLARVAKLGASLGLNVENFPLSLYRDSGFYVMRTDALDRFGTRLEQRFTKVEIKTMMESAGLESIRFSEETPFWCAVGYAKEAVCAA